MSSISYSHIERRAEDRHLVVPNLLPTRDLIIAKYGPMVWPGERLTLDEMASRIRAECGSQRISEPNHADFDAFQLVSWHELMKYTEDSIVNFNALPVEFFLEHDDVEYHYDFDQCLVVLGGPAVHYFVNEIAANEEECA